MICTIGWGIMVKKNKMDPKMIRAFLLLTLIFTVLGFSFGKILYGILLPNSSEDQPTVSVETPEETKATGESDETTEEKTSIEVAVNDENAIYIMQLGVFETYDNLLTLAGDLQKLGYNYGVTRTDGKYSVFSHISGTKESLESVEQALKSQNLTYFIKRLEIESGDLRWDYFLQAVKQNPFEMTSEFIQTFTDDEMHIFGYYMTLSNASFETLANERQKMLLEIYQWLTQ